MTTKRGPKPRVTYDGKTYITRRWTGDVPDLSAMSRMEALVWLAGNTTPTGYSRPKPNLPAIRLEVRVATLPPHPVPNRVRDTTQPTERKNHD